MEKILVVGLGNPGNEYVRTRHNLGIMALRYWVDSQVSIHQDVWQKKDKYNAEIAILNLENTTVTCLFPVTYMNSSGLAVKAFVNYNNIDLDNIVIVHDDIELLLGEVNLIQGGSAKGHNGVRSIYEELDTKEIKRVSMGVGRPDEQIEVKDYVLGKFGEEDQEKVEAMIKKASKIITSLID